MSSLCTIVLIRGSTICQTSGSGKTTRYSGFDTFTKKINNVKK